MKTYIKYSIIIFITALFLTGCEENYLEKTNPATLSYDKFYSTDADFQGSLNACYGQLKNQVSNLMIINELMSDNTFLNSYNATSDLYFFDSYNVATNSSTIKSLWQACYRNIMFTNMVISRIGTSKVSPATQKVFIAEAKFIRAYTYFNLVRIFGGVPKYDQEITDITNVYDVSRSSESEIYDFIISDLIAAQTIDSDRSTTQTASAKGKVNSTAVNALLGKVYLQKGDFANASSVLGNIVSSGGLSLEANLMSIYDASTPFNKEIIFEVNYERVAGQNSPFTLMSLPKFSTGILPNVTTVQNGDGDYNLEPVVVSKFLSVDKRKALIDSANIIQGGSTIKFYYSKKYLDLGTTSDSYSASDFIVLRYADVLLMYADALNQTNKTSDAYQYINSVRNRAGLGALPTGYTKDQMNDAIAKERQLEFLLEGDRWFDLSSRGFAYLKKTLNDAAPFSFGQNTATIVDNEKLFPLPADEVLLKPGILIQNPGY